MASKSKRKASASKRHAPKLNNLAYQILGVLLRQPRSGYDIVKELQYFRPAKTSQVYPTLAELEHFGIVSAKEIKQSGRPDKRVYSTTTAGRKLLVDWIGTEPELPTSRDDFLTMVYSGWTKKPADILAMVGRRLDFDNALIERYQHFIATLKTAFPKAINDPRNWRFYAYWLLVRRLDAYRLDAEWCQSLINRLKEEEK